MLNKVSHNKKKFSVVETKMDGKNVIDVSSFFLFEATGDSESDFEPGMAADVEKDDAESCICGLYDTDRVEDDDEFVDQRSPNDDDDDNDEVTIDQWWINDKMVSVDSDSGGELMDESAKNRLFWEACLAS